MKKLLLVLALIFTGCAVTYETPRCELMQRGERCLTNHACCNTTTYSYNYPRYNWWNWNKPQNNYIVIKPNKPNKPHYNKPNNRPGNKPNNRPNKGHRK